MSPDANAFARFDVGPNRMRFGVPVESQISMPFHGEPAAEVVVIEIAAVFDFVGTFDTDADAVATEPLMPTDDVPVIAVPFVPAVPAVAMYRQLNGCVTVSAPSVSVPDAAFGSRTSLSAFPTAGSKAAMVIRLLREGPRGGLELDSLTYGPSLDRMHGSSDDLGRDRDFQA
jgi:hypothetical protein